MKKYDYILIGSGPAAYRMSNLLADTSKRVLVIDGGLFGGTCPNYGCEPKIFLEGAARAVLQSQQLVGRGISHAATLDWAELMKTKLQRFDPWPEETKQIIAKSHDVEAGFAHFVNDETVEVNHHQYQGAHIVVATGQHPHRLVIPGTNFTHTSTDVLSLKTLPHRIVIIGAGYVGMELATLLGAAGAEVTIVVHSARPLRAFPASAAKNVQQSMEHRGIHFQLNTNVQAIKKDGHQLLIETDHTTLTADYVVDATGRQPNIAQLHLDAAGVAFDQHGIYVNHFLQTSNPHVYAIGDVVSRPQPKLTPVAEFEGQYLFNHLEKGVTAPIQYPTIGTAVFTFPEIAQAGVQEKDVQNQSGYDVHHYDLHYSSLSAGQNDQTGQLTLIHHNGLLVGASEVSDYAADDINNFLPLIGLQITSEDFRKAVIAIYPALADKLPM